MSQYVWLHIWTYVQNVDIYVKLMSTYMSRQSYMSECVVTYMRTVRLCVGLYFTDMLMRPWPDKAKTEATRSRPTVTMPRPAITRPLQGQGQDLFR